MSFSIYRERERERDTHTHTHIYTHIYIYIYIRYGLLSIILEVTSHEKTVVHPLTSHL